MTKRTLHATIQTAVHESSTSSLLGTCRYWLNCPRGSESWTQQQKAHSQSDILHLSLIWVCVTTDRQSENASSHNIYPQCPLAQTVYKRWKNETVSDGKALCKDQWGAHAHTQKMSDWLIKKGDFLNVLKMFLLSSEKLLRWEKMC